MYFCRLRKPHPDPTLILYGTVIPVVQEVKFLGLIFYSKLTFLPHLRYLKKKMHESYQSVARSCQHFMGC